jgi:predicted glycosyltransferase
MVEQVARFPALRDRALFVGSPDDVVPGALGPNLPGIREWTEGHFDFVGYVTGFEPLDEDARAEIRKQLGWRPDERVCVVTVGGSGAGRDLLRRAIAAHPYAAAREPALRTVVVTGPRIDPDSLRAPPGVEVHGYVPGLFRQLAAADAAVVQGGLTTTMELAANRTPFVYVPLRHHFEQNFHVRHRLDRYRAGRFLDYAEAEPEHLADVLLEEMHRPAAPLPVETDGARRAAERIAELL